ncbi:MAG TPA: filamentous hemagglutinin N-terminal domain-containing protein, partial [Burkholderiales bacterium]|nr:filamentous hemagglutinin N-terminal domain-containing protein [Burkholderiales bacterium]
MPLAPAALQAQTLPGGASVVNGAASFQQNGNKLTVTNSNGAIINWQSFSIGSGATVQFIQQNAASAVFNRVTGNSPSMILGNLNSNGRIFLINPNGVTIGAGARIDAAAFVASALGISNADLLAGKFKFEGGAGSGNVVNQGTIVTQSGGYVYFIGKDVENSGVIHSPNGQILLAAGKSVEIINPQSPNLQVEITASNNEAVNLGKLVAEGGTIGMFAGNIHQKGLVSATTAEVNAQGKIVFIAKKNVELAAGSVTEANGPNGGNITIQAQTGTATVAGTVEAKGTSTPVLVSGLPTYTSDIAAQNTITVTSSASGNGQQAGQAQPVFVIATPLPAPAKPAVSTDPAPAAPAPTLTGGTVEVMGETVSLTGNASIDASGEKGGGTILIGGDLHGANAAVQNALHTYVDSGVYLNADATAAGNGGKVVVWAEEDTHFVGSISAMGGTLNGNGGFVETSGKGVLFFNGRVSTAARREGYSAGTLLLDPSDVVINNGTDSAQGASFNGGTPDVYGGSTGASTLSWTTIDGELTNNNVVITTSGSQSPTAGNITIQTAHSYTSSHSLTLLANQDINVNASVANGGGGDIVMMAGWNGGSPSAPVVNTTGAGSITLSGGVAVSTLGNINLTAGNSITMAASSNLNANNVNLSANAGVATLGGITAANALNVISGGTITQAGASTLNVTGSSSFNSNGTVLTLDSNNSLSGPISLSGSNVTLVNNGAIVLGDSTTTGTLNVSSATGGISQSAGAKVVAVGNTTLKASGAGNTIILGNANNDFTAVSVTSGTTVTLTDTSDLNLSAVAGTGVLTATSGGILGVTGNVSGSTVNLTGVSISQSGGTLGSGGAAINLSATGGTIGQTGGSINTSGTVTVNANAGASNISLNRTANAMSGTINLTGATVTLVDSNAITLGAVTATDLNVSAATGGISQSGVIAASGNSNFVATGSNNDINLTGANNFSAVAA